MSRWRSYCARTRVARTLFSTRVCEVETLETRWLLTIDLASIEPDAAADISISPTTKVYQPFGASQPLASAGPTGKTPTQILHAYGFDQITFAGAIVGNGAGQTIAIVDAYDTPTIEHDLAAFNAAFGLPPPPSFIRVAQDGSTNYPVIDPAGPGGNNWEVETALDVEWIHALAPMANIILVEASSNGLDLFNAVDYARTIPNVSVISMSWGSPEALFSFNSVFTTPAGHIPITFVASTGDNGVPGGYPAFSPNVLAVGGTTLTLDASNNIVNETGWSGSGGGISQQASQPSYQNGIVTQSTTSRTIPDVSFDADPNTGASVYDSYNNGTAKPWSQIGGTSFAAPAWASLIAIADQGRVTSGLTTLDGRNATLPMLYGLPSSAFRDITSGNNGAAAGVGYDLVTGRGSPRANLVVAGLMSTSTFAGAVFVDGNQNGADDASENGLAGVTVYDDLNNNGQLDPPAVTTISSSFSPAPAIPDGSSNLTSTLTVGDLHGSIIDINVNLTIQHTRDSNLTVTLISPAGTSVSLISHNGGTGANFTNTTLDDQSATSISTGTATFTGAFRPIGSLASLIGQNPQGDWKLVVSDTVSGNTGTLVNWSLKILTPTEPSVSTDATGNFSFNSVTAGVHHLRDVLPPSFSQTTSGLQNVTAVAGNAAVINFGLLGSTVAGTIFLDSDGDGALDAGEIPLGGYVYDDLNNNGVPDSTSAWSVSSVDAPKAIADLSTIVSTTMVTGLAGTITDLNVNLTINHTRDSDLVVTLISPNGVYVPLLSHNGGTGANFTNTTLDDQATRSLTTGTAPFTNSYRPTSVLSAVNGLNPNGIWKLMVVDTVTGSTGTLTGWSLRFTTNAAEPSILATSGAYQFAALGVGAHHLRTFLPSTMTQTSPAGGAYNVTVSSQISVANDNFGYSSSIIAQSEGPYTINEGSPLALSGASPSDDGTFNYSWDLNGDGVYSDATGATPTLEWSDLVALGISNGPGAFTVRLRVDDGNFGVGLSPATTLTVLNVAPTASAGGPYTINEGSPLTLVGVGTDPVDLLAYFWDVNGDGVFGDAVGVNPTLTWSQLVALGVNNGPAAFNVRLSVNDGDGGVTTSSATTLSVLNVTPTVSAGGPYTINEGDSLSLIGLGVDPADVLNYSWDLNGDGVYGDATGASPTLIWSQLVALGVNNGPGSFSVSVRVDDGDGGTATSAATTLTVNNAAPVASVVGPASTLRLQIQSFTLNAIDASAADQAAGFDFAIDWGDGSAIQNVTGPSGAKTTHVYTEAGAMLVSVTATDQDGATSAAAVQSVNVGIAKLQPNTQNPALTDLVWAGSISDDQVQLTQVDPTTIRVTEQAYNGFPVNNVQVFSGVTGRVIATALAGNDQLDARGLTVPATLDGGAGANTIYGGNGGDLLIGGSDGGEGKQGSNIIIAGNGDNTIYGNYPTARRGASGGNNLIVGGTGHDTIYGNFGTNPMNEKNPTGDGGEGGQNLIVGGGGADTIYASQITDGAEGGKGSILIGGSTTLDQAALLSVLSEWTSSHAFNDKIANISGTPTDLNLNGANYLISGVTIFDDGAIDQLFSDTNGKPDWLQYNFTQDVANRAKVTDSLTNVSA